MRSQFQTLTKLRPSTVNLQRTNSLSVAARPSVQSPQTSRLHTKPKNTRPKPKPFPTPFLERLIHPSFSPNIPSPVKQFSFLLFLKPSISASSPEFLQAFELVHQCLTNLGLSLANDPIPLSSQAIHFRIAEMSENMGFAVIRSLNNSRPDIVSSCIPFYSERQKEWLLNNLVTDDGNGQITIRPGNAPLPFNVPRPRFIVILKPGTTPQQLLDQRMEHISELQYMVGIMWINANWPAISAKTDKPPGFAVEIHEKGNAGEIVAAALQLECVERVIDASDAVELQKWLEKPLWHVLMLWQATFGED